MIPHVRSHSQAANVTERTGRASQAVRTTGGTLVGVVAFSVPLASLTTQVASCLVVNSEGTCQRYAFVWDANRNGVVR